MSIITPLPPPVSAAERAAKTSGSKTRLFSVDDIESLISVIVNNVINGAPGALDQLNELANALGNDPNFATTITTMIAAINGLLNGAGPPSSGLGKNGDFYVDTTNKNFYGPKTSGAWSSYFSLIGTPGARGTQFFSGTAVPTNAASVSGSINGDWYIKTDTGAFYTLISGTWVLQFTGSAGGSGNALLLATML